jgi:hypothetical protein
MGNKGRSEPRAAEVPVFHFRDAHGLRIRECQLSGGEQFIEVPELANRLETAHGHHLELLVLLFFGGRGEVEGEGVAPQKYDFVRVGHCFCSCV